MCCVLSAMLCVLCAVYSPPSLFPPNQTPILPRSLLVSATAAAAAATGTTFSPEQAAPVLDYLDQILRLIHTQRHPPSTSTSTSASASASSSISSNTALLLGTTAFSSRLLASTMPLSPQSLSLTLSQALTSLQKQQNAVEENRKHFLELVRCDQLVAAVADEVQEEMARAVDVATDELLAQLLVQELADLTPGLNILDLDLDQDQDQDQD